MPQPFKCIVSFHNLESDIAVEKSRNFNLLFLKPYLDVIRKIVATNSIELDEITANTIPKRSRDKVKKVPIIPESFENKVEKSEKTITGPTILNNFKSSNLSKESGQTKALPEDNIQPNLENSESEVSNTPKWKKLVDTSSGIWQTSATKISSSKANVSNTFSSVVQLAKKVENLLTFNYIFEKTIN